MEETDPMMAMEPKKDEPPKEEEKKQSGCCNCSPLVWAIIGFFVVLIFIGLCFYKMNSDAEQNREHAPNEDEKRNAEEHSVDGKKPEDGVQAKSLL